MLNFFRTYCDCQLTTGKILRDEPQAVDSALPEIMGFPSDVYFNQGKGKDLAIMTTQLTKATTENLEEAKNSMNSAYFDRAHSKLVYTRTQDFDQY
mmetsp:Transcript_9627/g.14659  ORF Transcript_9627/g.14659 Transcript_9627/m.14659 type:complete len:96 (+) Transcript_9627:107-394(+)